MSLVASSGERYQLKSGSTTTIGSHSCDIVLRGTGVQRLHARVVDSGNVLALESLASPTTYRGSPLSGSVQIGHGDWFQIGSVGLRVVAPLFTAMSPSSPQLPAVRAGPPTQRPSQSGTQPQLYAAKRGAAPQLEGRVTLVDGPYQEDPDADTGRWLLRMMKNMVMLPFMIKQPGTWLAFTLGRRDDKVTIRFVRVVDGAGDTRVARLKGDVDSGIVTQGDNVSFWGAWHNGTLRVRHGLNHTANTHITLRK